MFAMKVNSVLEAVKGSLVLGTSDIAVTSVSIDSRMIQKGALFVPIKGEKFDGHDFIKDALDRGAVAFLIERWNEQIRLMIEGYLNQKIAAVKVRSTVKALQDLSLFLRGRLELRVVGITGSTGKTSTKDMITSVLSERLNVVSSEKSHNNEIGVPLTILKADRKTDVLVLEMAMRGLGQIEELAKIAQPEFGVVTNVGKTHYELLGSEELIAEAKSELVKAIPADGAVILNYDDAWTEKLKGLTRARLITYGLSKKASVRATQIEVDDVGRPSFMLCSPDGETRVSLPTAGRHNVYNALAAAAVGFEFNLNLETIKRGLEKTALTEMRMQVFTTADGIVVVNDAYNASPTSMKAALQALDDFNGVSRKIAVLGDMLELGKISDIAHFEIGEVVKNVGVELLITVGEKGKRIAEGAVRRGFDEEAVFACQSTTEAAKILKAHVRPRDIVLVKASRAMRLEEVLDFLL